MKSYSLMDLLKKTMIYGGGAFLLGALLAFLKLY